MTPRAVIFDCDGVLVDSVALANEILVEYLRDLGVTIAAEECHARFGSGKLDDDIARFERESGFRVPGDFVQELRSRREAVFRERLRPIDGVLDVLSSIRIPSCVASNGPLQQIRLSLQIVGLLMHFEGRIFSAYEVQAWKPDPGLFLHAARALGIPPAVCAVVEDSESGIEAGLAAGMTVFAYSKTGSFPARRGVRTIRDFAELTALLAGTG